MTVLPELPAAARSDTARRLTQALTDASGSSLKAVIFYGSQLVNARPNAASAWDLIVVVEDYAGFYKALHRSGHHRRKPWLLGLLNRFLPPNVVAFTAREADLPLAKCLIVSAAHLERALSPAAPDHFLKGRMVQQVALLWSSSAEVEQWVETLLSSARDDVLNWVGPSIRGAFDAMGLVRTMLKVSFAGELRPESSGRIDQLIDAQRAFLEAAYNEVMRRATAAGRARQLEDGAYMLTPEASSAERRQVERYFRRSKARSTLRWFKHIVTFNDWLTYIQKKVERRTGLKIEVTPWERRLPLLLLWPKVFYVLRHRNDLQREMQMSKAEPIADKQVES